MLVVVDVFVDFMVVAVVVVLTEEKSSWEKAESGKSSLVRVLLLRNDLFLASLRGGGGAGDIRLSSFSPSSTAPIMLLAFVRELSLFSRAASISKSHNFNWSFRIIINKVKMKNKNKIQSPT